MRLLNSVCRVIASAYSGVPVHIEEVPNNFERNSFYVTLATGSSELKNINVYEDDPIFQIVYFAKRNEANQVVAEKLYEVKEELKRLFLLKRVVPVIPLAGVKEKPRYAKIENYSDDVRVSEGALYVKITLNFTEDVPVEDNYELIGDVDIETKTVTNGYLKRLQENLIEHRYHTSEYEIFTKKESNKDTRGSMRICMRIYLIL